MTTHADLPIPAEEIDPSFFATHQDPPGVPWAMQLVVLTAPGATHAQALTAAARATVLLLQQGDSMGGEVRAAVERWRSGRIRKVVRRAKPGAAWERALQAPTLLMTVAAEGPCKVAAYCPEATDTVPYELSRLQVSGLDLPREASAPALVDAAVHVHMSPHIPLSTGKGCAQAAHAAQLAYESMPADLCASWVQAGLPVAVTFPSVQAWASVVADADVQVRDAGFTEIPPGSRTAVGCHWRP